MGFYRSIFTFFPFSPFVMAKRSTSSRDHAKDVPQPQTITWLRRTNLIWLAVFVTAGAITARISWQQSSREIRGGQEFAVNAARIKITPPPPYLRLDLTKEVANATFDETGKSLSILDPVVVEKVGQTLALNSWVSRVKRVQKHYPGELWIDLVYRLPVAVVEVKMPTDSKPGAGLVPIDAEGVVLDRKELQEREPSPLLTEKLIRIHALELFPTDGCGSKWNDARIAGAAKIAGLIADDWQAAGLYRIEFGDGIDPESVDFHLFSKTGDQVVWGSAPGREVQGEPMASQKLANLRAMIQSQGRFGNDKSAPRMVDLRSPEQAVAPAHPQR